MKARTKEENAAHARAQRLRKKTGSVSPVPPVPPAQNRTTQIVSPAATPGSCPDCVRLRAEFSKEKATIADEIAGLRAEVKRHLTTIATLEADQDAASNTKTPLSAAPNDSADTVALRKQMISNKISSFNRGHVIGTTRV